MKVRLFTCSTCFNAGWHPPMSLPVVRTRPVTDDGVHIVTCSQGHVTGTVHQNLRFELLFDSGGLALVDGYYREAVASFVAALERFFEFFLAVVCRARSADAAAFKDFWGLIKKRSEAQAGAFYLAHLLHTGRSFDNRALTNPEFRNKVVHQGYFPTHDEAHEYGREVYDAIGGLIDLLRSTAPDALSEEHTGHVLEGYRKLHARKDVIIDTVGGLSTATMLSVTNESVRPPFESALRSARLWRDWEGPDFYEK